MPVRFQINKCTFYDNIYTENSYGVFEYVEFNYYKQEIPTGLY